MKTYYTLVVAESRRPAIADVAFAYGLDQFISKPYILHRINVPAPARGNGYGTKLLKMVMADADAEQVTLMLAPESSGGLMQNDLIAWYHRHGFSFTSSLMMMERPPEQRP